MIRSILLLTICIASLSCAGVSSQQAADPAPSPVKPQPVVAELKLTAEQQKVLDSSLPLKVREILKNGEKFSLMTIRSNGFPKMGYTPDRVVQNLDGGARSAMLNSFYDDVVNKKGPSAACFSPQHRIVAEHEGQTVEIDICFTCSNFMVRSSSGETSGIRTFGGRKSQELINQIISEQGVAPQ